MHTPQPVASCLDTPIADSRKTIFRDPLPYSPLPRNKVEMLTYELVGNGPETHHLYITDEEIDRDLLANGITPTAESRQEFLDLMDKKMLNSDGKAHIMGMKPRAGEEIFTITITGSPNLVIRFFDGGLAPDSAFALDFFDFSANKAVNSPEGWAISIVPIPGTLSMLCSGPLKSWEENSGYRRSEIPPGEERVNMPEGALCQLDRPGFEPFWFAALRKPPPPPFATSQPNIST
ncbi:hypothetical protein B0H21DRAFT_802429 [Amylocystis lapponica]|nr:hypothetical protein B0H21DRAFT_802429 [Amylocystis lapponica]